MTSIEDGRYFEIGGRRQWVAVRGRDVRNPALLFVGGAGSGFAAIAPFFAPWEDDFTLVHWDQPGGGFTGGAPVGYAALAADCAAVADAVAGAFGIGRPVLLGTSGGTVIGLRAVAARPELFQAYVAAGVVTNRARQEQLSWELLLERARAAGDADAAGKLAGIGPPPYADPAGDLVKSGYANAPTPAEAAEWGAIMALGPPPPGAKHAPVGVTAGDPRAAGFAAWMASKDELYAWDARTLGIAFGVPIHVIQGADDAHTVTSEVVAWAAEVGASLALIPGAGHLSAFLREPMLRELKKALR